MCVRACVFDQLTALQSKEPSVFGADLAERPLLVQEPEFLDSVTSQIDPGHIKQTNCTSRWWLAIESVTDEGDAAIFIHSFSSVMPSRLFLQDCSLAAFLQEQSSQASASSDPQGFKRQEAIWELFTSECFYFLDQLMVLKEVTGSTQTHTNTQTRLGGKCTAAQEGLLLEFRSSQRWIRIILLS